MIQFLKQDETEVLTSYRQKIDGPTHMDVTSLFTLCPYTVEFVQRCR